MHKRPAHFDVLTEAAATLRQIATLTGDPLLYGRGQIDPDRPGKARPYNCNPVEAPPPLHDRWDRRVPSRRSKQDFISHVLGQAPLFDSNCANERHQVWAAEEDILPIALLWVEELRAALGDGEGMEEVVEPAFRQPQRGLTPRKTRQVLCAKPGSKAAARLLASVDPRHHPIVERLIAIGGDVPCGAKPSEEWFEVHRDYRRSLRWATKPKRYVALRVDLDGDGTAAGPPRPGTSRSPSPRTNWGFLKTGPSSSPAAPAPGRTYAGW